MRGTIRGNINRDRGFGFIAGEDGVDRFFHRSAVAIAEGARFEQLAENQAVEFDHEDGEKGPRAKNVRPAAATA